MTVPIETTTENTKAQQLLTYALVVGALAFVAVYLFVATARMGYPYELEWMESGLVDGVGRILDGAPLYVEPSVEFIPFAYPPLYHWLSAAVASITGLSYLPLRLVSLLSSLGSLLLIHALVRRETGARLAGPARGVPVRGDLRAERWLLRHRPHRFARHVPAARRHLRGALRPLDWPPRWQRARCSSWRSWPSRSR